jgi:hypothetical protein
MVRFKGLSELKTQKDFLLSTKSLLKSLDKTDQRFTNIFKVIKKSQHETAKRMPAHGKLSSNE